ncbi:MAG TPA: flagellar protein FlaG [Firmicutes bacterium]|nr:MAG: hypothetical protein AA931_10665 [Peptococcaceae bacterium 1109]HHT73606.1 flagellar protein FlaG [Bacillota bacterium]
MKISGESYGTRYRDLLTGDLPKLAARQVDQVEDLNVPGSKENHRVSFRYDKDLGKNVAHIIDNSTGKTVRQLPTPTQVDHMIRMRKLMGLFVDERA